MEKPVKIAEIDIGVDKLVSKTAKAKKEIAVLAAENKKLKDETGKLTNATQEQLEQYTRNEVQMKSLRKETQNNTKVLDAYINIQNQDIKTKDQARDANRKLIAIANQLDTTNKDHEDTLKKINNEIDRNTDFIKENASEYEKTKIGIGNYKEAITGALGELGIFGKAQGVVNQVTKDSGPIINFLSTNLKDVRKEYKKAAAETYGMSKAQVAAHLTSTTLTAGLKILKIALAATGIGAVVLVLGSLITYLATTQEGMNKVNMVLTPLKEAFNAVKGSVQELGAAFAKLFSGDIKGFLGDIKEIGSEMKTNIKEAVDRGKEMERIQQNLNKTEADYITLQAKLRKEFEQQKKLSDDTTKSTEEREKAAQRAIDLQAEISKGSIERIKQEAEILRMKQMSNDTSDAERAELATKLAEIDKALEEEAAKTTEAQNKLNAIRKEGQLQALENQKKVIDAAIKSQEQELALYEEQQRLKQKTDEEQLVHLQNLAAKEQKILEVKLKNKLISETEYQTEVLKLENGIAEKKAEFNQAELDRTAAFEEKKKALQEEIQISNAENELERAQIKAELDFEKHVAELEQMQLREEQKTELLILLETQRDEVLAGIRQSFQEQRLESFQQVMDQDIAIRQKNAQEAANIAGELTGILSGLLGDSLAAKLASIAVDAAIQAGLVSITTASSQAQNLAQATATAPPPFNLPFIAAAMGQNAALQAQSSAAMSKILASAAIQGLGTSIKSLGKKPKTPKAAQGAVLDINGRSHSQGGETFYDSNGNPIIEAQGGEKMVILKREASRELDVLSRLNQKHGGVSLSTPVSYAANGGAVIRNPQVTSSKSFKLDYNRFSDLISTAVAEKVNSIQTVVPVDSINNVNYKNAKVERGSDL